MALKVYVSTDKASYFKTNVLRCEENPPTYGSYKVGDIIISSTQDNDVIGWVCTKSGEPGKWKSICDIYEVKRDLNTHEVEITRINNTLEIIEYLIDEMYLNVDHHDKKIKEIEANSTNNNALLQIGIEKNVEEINKLNERLLDIEGDVIDIVKNNIFDAVGDLEGLFSDSVKLLQNDVAQLHEDVENNTKNLSNLRKDVNTNITNIGNLNDQMNDVVADLNTIKNNIGDIVGDLEGDFSETVEQIQNQVLKNTNDIASINVKLNNFENVHNQLQERVNINTNAIGNINMTIRTLDDSIEMVEGNVEQLQEIVIGLQNTITANNNKLAQIDKNTNNIASIKQGLIDALINKGVDVNNNMTWEDLFGNLLDNLGNSENPEEPPSDSDISCTRIYFTETSITITDGQTYNLNDILVIEPSNCTEKVTWSTSSNAVVPVDGIITSLSVGSAIVQATCGGLSANIEVIVKAKETEGENSEAIYLLQNGKFNNNTPFGNARPTEYMQNSTLYPDCLHNKIIPSLSGFSYITMCFDGYADINSYEKVEIVAATGYTYDTTIAVGVLDEAVELAGSDSTSFDSLPLKTKLTYTKFKSYTFDISDLNKDKNGYLTIGIHVHNTSAQIQIKDIILYPKQRTDGIVLFDRNHDNPETEFGYIYITESVNTSDKAGFIKDAQGNKVIGYNFIDGMLKGYFSFDKYMNFNNYDTIEITAYTENNDQEPLLLVARGKEFGEFGYVASATPQTIIPNAAQAIEVAITSKKQPTVYSVSIQELAKSSGFGDGNSGYLYIGLARNVNDEPTTDEGYVYISKIVVYPEA